jgi:pimeloyl-ACP methyl ester carboxylesterase
MRNACLSFGIAWLSFAAAAAQPVRTNHYVRVKSQTPAISGQFTQIYVREIQQPGAQLAAPEADRVVLFVHGAGTPAEVAFDAGYSGYSWAAYIAKAGFDVFTMDLTGYGRSTRPWPMNDQCNLTQAQQAVFAPSLFSAPCSSPSYAKQLTTIASDWADIDGVVDYLLALRHVDKVTLIGWSQGGPRAGGYAAQHPDKVRKLILLAPAYGRNSSTTPPEQLPANDAAFNTQSRTEFFANWDRQVGCPDQYDKAAADAVWSEMLESDPVGSTWGEGVRRAPQETVWGWNQALASKLQIPVLLVSGAHDKQVNPNGVRTLYGDLTTPKKVFVDLACSSHNALGERNHLLLFGASLEWLTKTTVDGKETGLLRRGY